MCFFCISWEVSWVSWSSLGRLLLLKTVINWVFFSCFEDYAYCLIYVFDVVLVLILPHHLADVLPKWYPKLLSKVVQIVTNQVGKNDSKNDRIRPEKCGPKSVSKSKKSL